MTKQQEKLIKDITKFEQRIANYDSEFQERINSKLSQSQALATDFIDSFETMKITLKNITDQQTDKEKLLEAIAKKENEIAETTILLGFN